MAKTIPGQATPNIEQMVTRIQETGNLSRADYFWLVKVFLSDASLTKAQKDRINQVFDSIKTGKIKLI